MANESLLNNNGARVPSREPNRRAAPNTQQPQEDNSPDVVLILFIIIAIAAIVGSLFWHFAKYKDTGFSNFVWKGNITERTGYYRPTWAWAEDGETQTTEHDVKLEPVKSVNDLKAYTHKTVLDAEKIRIDKVDWDETGYYESDQFDNDLLYWRDKKSITGESTSFAGHLNMTDHFTYREDTTVRNIYVELLRPIPSWLPANVLNAKINTGYKWDETKGYWTWSMPWAKLLIETLDADPTFNLQDNTCRFPAGSARPNVTDPSSSKQSALLMSEIVALSGGFTLLNAHHPITSHEQNPYYSLHNACDTSNLDTGTGLMPYNYAWLARNPGDVNGPPPGIYSAFADKEFPNLKIRDILPWPEATQTWIQHSFSFKKITRNLDLDNALYSHASTDADSKEEFTKNFEKWRDIRRERIWWNNGNWDRTTEYYHVINVEFEKYYTTLDTENDDNIIKFNDGENPLEQNPSPSLKWHSHFFVLQ